jgi:nucleotide-binding universal stress UspA family protein
MQSAVALARDLSAPLVFVYVRRRPSAALGAPYYQRRLDREIQTGKRVLDTAMALAQEAGVPATTAQLEGNPARRVAEFARLRGARMVVLGSRRRRLRRSVSREVVQAADRPVLVAGRPAANAV